MGKPDKFQKAVGRCGICGRYPTWFNDVPLTAYCWGRITETGYSHEDKKWSKVVPEPVQPYK